MSTEKTKEELREASLKLESKEFAKDLPGIIRGLDTVRAGGPNKPTVEISLAEFLTEKYGLTQDEYIKKLGFNSKVSTMQNILSMPDTDYRWIIPEIIRDAIQLGIKDAPFYPTLIAGDQSVNGLSITMPYVNPSDAAPAKVNEAETIPLGQISYGQKTVKIYKIGKGIKISDEVKNYVALDVLGIYFRDFGIQLGFAMDNLAIDCLVNGNKADGSEASGIIGVGSTSAGLTYKDLLKLWIRGSRFGRNFRTMVSGEDMALNLLDLNEFKKRESGTTLARLNLKTQIPSSSDLYIHGGVDENSILFVDPTSAMIKLTAQNLMLESERIVSNQTSAMYASLTTGFSKMFMDASILMDKTVAFDSFPSYFDLDSFKSVNLE